jgi:hypothetical protein
MIDDYGVLKGLCLLERAGSFSRGLCKERSLMK